MTPKLTLVVAIAANGVIGKANGLPWHIPSDLKHFRALTLAKPVIMGRKTFESIGRALPGRETIVVTRDPAFILPPGVHRCSTIEAALELGARRAVEMGAPEIVLAGGADIFAALVDRIDLMHVTFVHASPEGDVLFPPIDWSQWEEISREEHPPQKSGEPAFAFVDFRKKLATPA